MLSIYTYPDNAATRYIDPDYYGVTSPGNGTGYIRRIRDLIDGTYKAYEPGQYVTTESYLDVINATGRFYKAIDDVSGILPLQMHDYWEQPLITVGTSIQATGTVTDSVNSGPTINDPGAPNIVIQGDPDPQRFSGVYSTFSGFDGDLSHFNNIDVRLSRVGFTIGTIDDLSLLWPNGYRMNFGTNISSSPQSVGTLTWDDFQFSDVKAYGHAQGELVNFINDVALPTDHPQNIAANLTNADTWAGFTGYVVLDLDNGNPNNISLISKDDYQSGTPTEITRDSLVMDNGNIRSFYDSTGQIRLQSDPNAPNDPFNPDHQPPNGECVRYFDNGVASPNTQPITNTYLYKIQMKDHTGAYVDDLNSSTILYDPASFTDIELNSTSQLNATGGILQAKWTPTWYPSGSLNGVNTWYGVGGNNFTLPDGLPESSPRTDLDRRFPRHGFFVDPLYDSTGRQINMKSSHWDDSTYSGDYAGWAPICAMVNNDLSVDTVDFSNPNTGDRWVKTDHNSAPTGKWWSSTNRGLPSSETMGSWTRGSGELLDPYVTIDNLARTTTASNDVWLDAFDNTPWEGKINEDYNVKFNWNGSTTRVTEIEISYKTSVYDFPTGYLKPAGAGNGTFPMWISRVFGTYGVDYNPVYVEFVNDLDTAKSIGACIQANSAPVTTTYSGYTTITAWCWIPGYWDPNFSSTTIDQDFSGQSIGKSWTQNNWVEQSYDTNTNEFDNTANFTVISAGNAPYGRGYNIDLNNTNYVVNLSDSSQSGSTQIGTITVSATTIGTNRWNALRTGTEIVAGGLTYYLKLDSGNSATKSFKIYKGIAGVSGWTQASIANSDLTSITVNQTTLARNWVNEIQDGYFQSDADHVPGVPYKHFHITQNEIAGTGGPYTDPLTNSHQYFVETDGIKYASLPTAGTSMGTYDYGMSGLSQIPRVESTTGTITLVDGHIYTAGTPEIFLGGNKQYKYRTGESTYAAGASVSDYYYDVDSGTQIPWASSEHNGLKPTFAVSVDAEGYLTGVTASGGRINAGKKMILLETDPDTYTPPEPTPAEAEDIFDTDDEWANNGPSPLKIWPNHVTPMSAAINYSSPTIVNNSQNGVKYTRASGFTKWRLEVEYPPMSASDFKQFHAIAQAAHGQSTPFYFMLENKDNTSILWNDFNTGTSVSNNTPRLISPITAGDETALFGGFNSNETDAFVQGEVFFDGNNENGFLHTSLSGTDSNVYGEAKIRVPMAFREDKAVGDVIYKSPNACVVTLNSDDFEYSVDVNNYYYVNVAFDLDGWK